MSKKVKKKKKTSFFVKFLIFVDVCALTCFFLAYGPISFFRDLLITTAMTTMEHKYLAYILYDEETVEEVLANNRIIESGESTDTSAINTELAEDTGVYESIYEEQILKREAGQQYKILDISGKNWKGYMAVIYDPADIELAFVDNYGKSRGAYISTIGKKNNALVAMTASGVQNKYGKYNIVTGSTIKDGKIYAQGKKINKGGGIIGFTKDNVLVLTKKTAQEAIDEYNMDRAVEFGPFLIVNGKPSTFSGKGDGVHPRTAIAQRQDGIVLFVVIEGRRASSVGISLKDLSEFFLKYKAYNAANLDGGGSSSLYAVVDGKGKLLNEPGGYNYEGERYMANAWVVLPKKEVATESEE